MDYRHTEDFARMAEAASLRARELRGEAVVAFWQAIAGAWRSLMRALHRRLERQLTSPEA